MSDFPQFKPNSLLQDYVRYETRRQFFKRGASLMGTAALAMLAPNLLFADDQKSAAQKDAEKMLRAIGPQFPPKAKQVIYLHMVGGPSQLDLFDYKPKLGEWFDKDLPDSVRMGQRITTMTSRQKRHVDLGAVAMDCQDGGRPVLRAFHEHRRHQSRAGHHVHADRQSKYGK